MSSKEQQVRSAHNLATVRPSEPDWGAVIQRIAGGDRAALADLYDGTAALVHGLTIRILGDRSAAEEATADTFVQVWRQANRWDASRGGPLAWLLMLARSRAIDRLRASGPRRAECEASDESLGADADAPTPEENAAVAERRRLVRGALARLAPEQRRLIELAYFEGLSHTEIAASLEQPLGTVKTRIRIGMTRLRQTLGPAVRDSL
jgi:RNA polymerase sigma-70 factor (ECF subfamily)